MRQNGGRGGRKVEYVADWPEDQERYHHILKLAKIREILEISGSSRLFLPFYHFQTIYLADFIRFIIISIYSR